MGNRNNDKNTAYFELGKATLTLSTEASEEEVDTLLQKIDHSEHCVGVKLNPAWEVLSEKYPQLEKKVFEKSCYAVNSAVC